MTFTTWTAWVERHHRAIVVGSLLVGLLSALSLTRLRLDIDVLGMLPRGEPAFDDFKAFVGDFGQLDELLVLIEGASPADLRRFADDLAPRLAAIDGVREVHARVDADAVMQGLLGETLFNYLPEEAYAEIEARLQPAAIDAQVSAFRAILSAPFDLTSARLLAGDPFSLRRLAAQHLAGAYAGAGFDGGYFAARDGDALLIFVRPSRSAFDIAFSRRLLDAVEAAAAATRQALALPDVRSVATGSYAFALEDAATMQGDIVRYTLLALLGVLFIFYLGFGNLRVLPFVTYPLVVSTLATFALSLLLYDQLNALSLSFAAILYGLSIDARIYFYSRLAEERRRAGGDERAAIAATLAGLARANLLNTATTAAAFLVIGLSALGALRELGVLTAIGMGLTTLEFFLLFPAMAFLFGGWEAPPRILATPRLGHWSAAAARAAWPMRIALVAAGAALLAPALRLPFDPTLTRLRPAESAALRTQEEIERRFLRDAGSGAVLVRRADSQSALRDAERVAARLRAYRSDGRVRSVQSIDALLPSAETQRARLARYAALPRAAALEHLATALRAQGFKPERFAQFFAGFAAPRTHVVQPGDAVLAPLAFVVDHHVRRAGEETIVAVYADPGRDGWPALDADLRRDLPDLPLAVAARPLLEHRLGAVLRHEMVLFLALAGLGNLVLLTLALRSLRDGLAVLAPIALVVLLLFAGMSLAGVPVDPINLAVTTLVLGIGVDSGVYLVTMVRQLGSVREGVTHIGRAIVVTSLTTIAGFGFLAFSAYPPLATMGRLMAAGLGLCLLATLFVLPTLLPAKSRTS